ncbi:MAG: tautomerase family protein [Proteobacteria bacterium]|nr:tautomerase family protein [Pseudomonadota bacterium]
MPHIIIKLYPGRSQEQKQKLTDAIVRDVVSIAKCEAKTVSVAIEDVSSNDWDEKVFKPDILGNKNILFKEPEN